MANQILMAVIVGAIGVASGAISFYLTKRAERQDGLQERKREHYRELLGAISDLADHSIELAQARSRFANAVNTVALVAPQYVIDSTMAYYRSLGSRPLDQAELQANFRRLILDLRRSLGLPFEDDRAAFDIELVATATERE
jgi:hypothetical protein